MAAMSTRTSLSGASISMLGSPAHVAVLVKDNHASKLAVRLAKALISPALAHHGHRITLVHIVGSDYATYTAEQKVLAQFNQDPEYKHCISFKVLVQNDGVGLTDIVSEAVAQLKPHLLVIGSQGLCNDTLTEIENARTRPGAVPLGSTIRRKPSRLSTAMRLAQALHQQVPLLLVKDNSVGAFSTGSSSGLRCMIDLSSTSRHALDWLLGRLQAARGDSMVLAVGRALDTDNRVRQHAVRLLTTFGVQASVSPLGAARKRLMREQSHKGLPSAVVTDEVDILLLHAPRCRDLSPNIMELVVKARTAVLLWPPDMQADGTTVKPMHPLRALFDESLPPEARPVPAAATSASLLKLAQLTQQETLLGARDGMWISKAPRLSFREHFGDEASGPAFVPLQGHAAALRRSLSDAARGAGVASSPFLRMERVLQRSMSTAASRTGIQAGPGDDQQDVAEEGAAAEHVDSSTAAGSRRAAPATHTAAPGGCMEEEAGDEDAAFDVEPERRTWPPRAGPVTAILPLGLPPRARHHLPPTLAPLVEETEQQVAEQAARSSLAGDGRGSRQRPSRQHAASSASGLLPALPTSPSSGVQGSSLDSDRARFVTVFNRSGNSGNSSAAAAAATALDTVAASQALPVLRSSSSRSRHPGSSSSANANREKDTADGHATAPATRPAAGLQHAGVRGSSSRAVAVQQQHQAPPALSPRGPMEQGAHIIRAAA